MDPIAALVQLITLDSHTAEAKDTARELAEWAFKGGFKPTVAAVMAECASLGLAFYPRHRILCIVYGCPE